MTQDEQRILEELGRTQTAKDARAAYEQIVEADRKLAVKRKHHRQNQEKMDAEVETFIDDLVDITGLPENSPLFRKIMLMIMFKRLARRNLANEIQLSRDSFPDGW